MKTSIKKELPLIVITIIPIIVMIFLWDKLPEQLPIHFDFSGNVDNYGSKYIFFLLTPALYLLLLIGMFINPLNGKLEQSARNFYKIRVAITVMFSAIPVTIIAHAVNSSFNIIKALLFILSLLFVLLGNYLITIKKNWLLGIRTPWTLQSDEVWRKTHRIGGKLLAVAGLIAAIVLFVCNVEIAKIIFFLLIAVAVIVPVVYSFVIFKKLSK